MSKYPIELIEADFVQKRMTFEELIMKYGMNHQLEQWLK